MLERIVQAALSAPEGEIFEIGVGTGELTRTLLDAGRAVTGVDLSPEMLQVTRERVPEATLVPHDIADGMPTCQKDRRFAAIIAANGINDIDSDAGIRLMRELFGRLLPGGSLIIGNVRFDGDAGRIAYQQKLGLPIRFEGVSTGMGILTLTKPCMLLFDYGGTLAQERSMDTLRGYKTLMPYFTENPRGVTAEALDNLETGLFYKMDPMRIQMGYEVHNHALMRFVQEYLGLASDLPLIEQESLFWESAAPAVAMDGITELLSALRRDGIGSAIISNMMFSGEALARRIRMLFPDHEFAFIIATSEYIIRKPSHLIFELALRKANLKPTEVWYLGDNYRCDVEGARSAGISPVWLHTLGEGETADCLTIPDWKTLTAILS